MNKILSIKNLNYTYKTGRYSVPALIDLTFDVAEGEIFGFIGPNGAGKTTTIKILLNILEIQKGEVLLSGKFPSRTDSREEIGYMPEIANYYWYLTPRELLNMYGRIFGIDKITLKTKVPVLLNLVGLENAGDRIMRTFSKGMMQKISFAQALINDPKLLILDEPMGGLDPVSRKKMRDVILELRSQGKTIFFSSHELSEVELISDRIGILNNGSLLAVASTKNLLTNKGTSQSLEHYFLDIITNK
ncbi:MAG: ABC transporter ATP-binding protein [Candidatus Omnitrophota bacterium]|nr:ABC transporter ATP-binding protein [Candidatus Omnitrophota bacterium]MBU1894297.1 ABC transporter ATP-binding protein [Candidatus Omnitrophota bacterium]